MLIVGGGTGWILEELAKVHPNGLSIVYLEISAKMIERSNKRDAGGNAVEFVNQGVEEFISSVDFDIVFTPFLFDNFSQERAELVFKKLSLLLKKGGRWLLVDFTLNTGKGRWWKILFIKLMYQFFKLLRIVEASRLPDIQPYFDSAAYDKITERFYYGNFIQSLVYRQKDK